MGTIILQVVIVLGIIIAGGFLIFFLGDLLISIIDPKGEQERVKEKKKGEAKQFIKSIEKLNEEEKEELSENKLVSEIAAEVAVIENEIKAEPEPQIVAEEYNPEEEKVETQDNEPSEQESIAEARAALEKRKAEILKRMQQELEGEAPSSEEEQEDIELAPQEPVIEEVELSEESEIEEPAKVEDPQQIQLREELEKAKRDLEEEKARYEKLIEELKSAKSQSAEIVTIKSSRSKAEIESQIIELEERLSANEKEFKACKKEYLPLAKVSKNLANDEKKLRRKEAIVAKQKVMLYGVNNYADIDEEKAKRLAEELDLLDGLKLSVQHCHEVMEANKDRFPVLEKMYFILKAQNEQLKNDIMEAKMELENADEQPDAE